MLEMKAAKKREVDGHDKSVVKSPSSNSALQRALSIPSQKSTRLRAKVHSKSTLEVPYEQHGRLLVILLKYWTVARSEERR